MKTYFDIIKMANAMQKERELDHEISIPDPVRFEQSFNEIFCGDETFERAPKHKTSVEIHSQYGHSIHDF